DTTVTLPEYVKKVYQLDSMYSSLDTRGLANGLRDWSKDILYSIGNTAIIDTDVFAAYVGTITYFAIRNSQVIRAKRSFLNDAVEHFIANDLELGKHEKVISWSQSLANPDNAFEFTAAISKEYGLRYDKKVGAKITWDDLKQAGASTEKAMKTAAGVVAGVITAVIIIVTWVVFAANTKDMSNAQRDFARMQAWITTFLLTLQLIISLLLIA
ncbi:MAG: hypothetical protein GY839_03330, partial [candidate division Zixibacteria bacterium]|nr:hypothetical protein [candidate division Zixibacteria bacterium]